jgi:hypothetical protein
MLDDGTVCNLEMESYRTRLAIHMARLQDENEAAGMYISVEKSILRSSQIFFEFYKVIIRFQMC